MTGWGWAALVTGGIFTAAVVYFAVVRVPRWRGMEVPDFLPDFARAIRVADKVQPTFLTATIASAVLMAGSLDGAPDVLARAAIAGFSVILIASVLFMVPLQRRMIRLGADPAVPTVEMRSRWLKGQLGRASLSVVSFALLALAVLRVG